MLFAKKLSAETEFTSGWPMQISQLVRAFLNGLEESQMRLRDVQSEEELKERFTCLLSGDVPSGAQPA